MDLKLNLLSLFGVYGLCFIAWLTSERRDKIPWELIKYGLGIQFVLGLLIFVVPVTRDVIVFLNNFMNAFLDASEAGARFLFGNVFVPDPSKPNPTAPNIGFVFAFRALPQVIFFSGVISLAYRLNMIQPIVKVFAKFFYKTMKISGAESLSGAANIFVGIESVVAIRPYLEKMTRSEICAVLSSCFGSISSTVLGLYATLLRPSIPTITGHLMAASVLTIPACFVLAKIIVPETEIPLTMGGIPEEEDSKEEKKGLMDTLIKGTIDGVQMAVGIAAVIIGILGIFAIVNTIFSGLAGLEKSDNVFLILMGMVFKWVSLDNIFALLFFPLTFLTGVSWDMGEVWKASTLIGNRLVQTSIPSFIALQQYAADGAISQRTLLIVSYVLCGFAHIPSMGIFIGGMTSLVPSRANDISSVALKALWAATLATLMTGCIAGIYEFGSSAVFGK
ncbi:MAG: nucleoside:proton symporter [Leptospiraceae bacterium]|nr:hypothetical protein [Leptospiraceae bacterium]MCP5494116.1 nucleoside:proton symporter [Leptospiraceae bacterium]